MPFHVHISRIVLFFCFFLNETRLRRLNYSVFDSEAALLTNLFLWMLIAKRAVNSQCPCVFGDFSAEPG